jgi:hypothetical protein
LSSVAPAAIPGTTTPPWAPSITPMGTKRCGAMLRPGSAVESVPIERSMPAAPESFSGVDTQACTAPGAVQKNARILLVNPSLQSRASLLQAFSDKISPFAPSMSNCLNFKLPVESSTYPQPLQDVLL